MKFVDTLAPPGHKRRADTPPQECVQSSSVVRQIGQNATLELGDRVVSLIKHGCRLLMVHEPAKLAVLVLF
ncbi:hypothetical protein BaRGS_00016111 [Batillaria attramentaria]|uniref:Uncharacterized protein n=1 Tax=Batillaria attramentaria TaxID=370345 RepID=A0ABD0KZL8_9CAEN